MKNPPQTSSLDTALLAWAEKSELLPQRVADMRENILASESAAQHPIVAQTLPPEWWRGFYAELNLSLHQSLHPDLFGNSVNQPFLLPS